MNRFVLPTDHVLSIRTLLASGPLKARHLVEKMGVSQATLSRAMQSLGNQIIRFGHYQSIHYALRRPLLAVPDIPIYRVTPEGQVETLGQLSPVQPTGYVMTKADGSTSHSEGFPWWLDDMRPQGFLGRAFVAAQAATLALPPRLGDWQEEHILRALLSQPGSDAIGNLIVGDAGRTHFIQRPEPVALPAGGLAAAYAERARQALNGETPASSAGGEQPKFGAYAETANGARHVLVKFSLDLGASADNPIAQRWRDLLLAEHHALTLLRENAIAAVATRIIDHSQQRFLEVERFDRIGPHGRRGLISLSAMDAEFIGLGRGGWPAMTARLLAERHITSEAHQAACLLHAFGTLIGNTDMHPGNLSFVTDSGRPYDLAPAYDMLPMAFAPRSSGELPATLPAAGFYSQISTTLWDQALKLAQAYLERLNKEAGFTGGFGDCLAALERHVQTAAERIGRLG
ncbi:type II toxin-antitoxin system HipA family toxin YjjJ [Azonexus sp.]|uniref:type II toxin-antitoxin system HipA family toxin YjjJ n=1 Tax=Azonexus sp. TaxID=1872668 RepID=UPI0027B90F12|nr:type II toxin-antitoxin system HipA family toxin YjjJ [Azonexus sp.]